MKKDTLPQDEQSFPANLIAAIALTDESEPLNALAGTDSISVYAAMAAARLTEREATVLMMRYRDGMDMLEVGKHYCVTRERIRQIEAKALRKMRGVTDSAQRGILTSGLMPWIWQQVNRKAEEIASARVETFKRAWYSYHPSPTGVDTAPDTAEQDAQITVLMKPIEELDLSIRSYNCLKRANINTVGDIAKRSFDNLMHVRNLGRRSADEITRVLTKIGVKLSAQDVSGPVERSTEKDWWKTGTHICPTCRCPVEREMAMHIPYCTRCGTLLIKEDGTC